MAHHTIRTPMATWTGTTTVCGSTTTGRNPTTGGILTMSWCSVSASLNLKDFVSLNFETLDLEPFDPLTFTREASRLNLKRSYFKPYQLWAIETGSSPCRPAQIWAQRKAGLTEVSKFLCWRQDEKGGSMSHEAKRVRQLSPGRKHLVNEDRWDEWA